MAAMVNASGTGETLASPAAGRRTAIADAAIAVLAADGSRGLTHRAVDRVLELPEGSTSAYLRTRAKLFAAATIRLAELDRASIEGLAATLPSGAKTATVADLIAAIVDDWTAPAAAPRQLARIELQLESVRNPEVAEVLAAQRAAFIGLVRTLLQSPTTRPRFAADDLNADDLDAVAALLTAVVDGLIADRLLHGRTALPAAELADALTRLLPDRSALG